MKMLWLGEFKELAAFKARKPSQTEISAMLRDAEARLLRMTAMERTLAAHQFCLEFAAEEANRMAAEQAGREKSAASTHRDPPKSDAPSVAKVTVWPRNLNNLYA